jgi:hypothetical protein
MEHGIGSEGDAFSARIKASTSNMSVGPRPDEWCTNGPSRL